MPITVSLQDKTNLGKVNFKFTLQFEKETITVEELIRRRIEQEVEKYNNSSIDTTVYNGLVTPQVAEQVLNGFTLKEKQKRKQVDAEKQFYIAAQAFQQNGYFVLVDNKQVESLLDTITLTPKTQIDFIKLIPLVGG